MPSSTSALTEQENKPLTKSRKMASTPSGSGEEGNDPVEQPRKKTIDNPTLLDHINQKCEQLDNDIPALKYGIPASAIILMIAVLIGFQIRGAPGKVECDQIEAMILKYLDKNLKERLTEKLDLIDTDMKETISDLRKQQKTSLEELSNSLTESDKQVKESASDVKITVHEFKSTLDINKETIKKLGADAKDLQTTTETVMGALKSGQEAMDKSIDEFQSKTDNALSAMQEKQKELTKTLQDSISNIRSAIDQEHKIYTDALNDIASKTKKTQTDFWGKITELDGIVTRLVKGLDELENIIRETRTTTDGLQLSKTSMDSIVGNYQSNLHIFKSILPAADYTTWALVILNITLSVLLMCRKDTTRNVNRDIATKGVPTTAQHTQRPAQRTVASPRMVVPTGPPRYAVTVVTFTEETLDQAREVFPKVIPSAWPAPGSVEYKMQTGELDLSGIPSSRGYIVIISYDARNSIVEDMDGSMGSRKRQTIVGLQQTNRDVLVIYLDNDYQIAEPLEGTLYNTNLDRPTSHPVLRPLVERQRFMSFRHWKVSRVQVAHIERWLNNL